MSLPRQCLTSDHPLELLSPGLKLEKNVLFSGGAKGADAEFGKEAKIAGFQVIHWSFSGHATEGKESFRRLLSKDVLEKADVHLKRASTSLCRSMPKSPYTKKLLRRDLFQVYYADCIYAVSYIDENDTDSLLKIIGGTAWACQMYVDRFKPIGVEAAERCRLYFFNITSKKWLQWNPSDAIWMNIEKPEAARGRCAGIGARSITTLSKQAIASLFFKNELHIL